MVICPPSLRLQLTNGPASGPITGPVMLSDHDANLSRARRCARKLEAGWQCARMPAARTAASRFRGPGCLP